MRYAILGMMLTLSSTAHALKDQQQLTSLTVVAPQIPWLLDLQHPGPYNDLMDELFTEMSHVTKVSILPTRRARRQFFSGGADCLFPASQDSIYHESPDQHRDGLLVSKPVNRSYIRVFSRTSEPQYNDLEVLENAKVTVDLSLSAVDFLLPNGMELLRTKEVRQAHALLLQGRAKAALMVEYDYQLFVARNPNKEQLHFHPDFELGMVEDALMCIKSEQAIALIEHVNKRIETLMATGALSDSLIPNYARSKRRFAGRSHPYLLRSNPIPQ